MTHRIAEQAPMPRKVSKSMTTYLTPEQDAAAESAMHLAGYTSASDWLRDLIQRECERQGIVWPRVELKWGDENRIGRMRKRKENEG